VRINNHDNISEWSHSTATQGWSDVDFEDLGGN
jgi:hypothetical protein